MDRRRRLLSLADLYASLLTERQRETLALHLERDWSISEVARAQGVSRAAVHDLVRRTEQALDDYETKLHLSEAVEARRALAHTLESRLDELQEELRQLRRTVKAMA